MVRRWIAATVAALAVTGPALADWKASYRAYAEAMEAGDAEAARRHAEAAWRQSRDALPAGENRALLAQNYGDLVLFSDPESAALAWGDAAALAAEGFGLESYPGTGGSPGRRPCSPALCLRARCVIRRW